MRLLLLLYLLSAWGVFAYVPFNPIFQYDGSLYDAYIDNAEYVIGWLELPHGSIRGKNSVDQHLDINLEKGSKELPFDRILAACQKKEPVPAGDNKPYFQPDTLIYIQPTLQKGKVVFSRIPHKKQQRSIWYSDWYTWCKQRAHDRHTYRGHIDDAYWFQTVIPQLGQTPQPSHNPQKRVKTLSTAKDVYLPNAVAWSEDDMRPDSRRVFRPWLVYDVMGVTESYMQELLRQCQKTKNPEQRRKRLFPALFADAQESDFEVLRGRQAIVHTGTFADYTIRELRKYFDDNIRDNNKNASAYVQILDGFLLRNQDPYADKVAQNALGAIEGGFIQNATAQGISEESPSARALRITDVQYLQDSSENAGAVFMIASNFNALEGGRGIFENRLENMQYTPVQGENAALTTMGASLKRKYVSHTMYTQSAPHAGGINLLQELQSDNVLMVNENGNVTRLNKPITTDMTADIKIGVHNHVVPTSGFYYPYSRYGASGFHSINASEQVRIRFLENLQYLKNNRDPLYIYNAMTPTQFFSQHHIHQVFTAALNVKNYQTYTNAKEDAETTAQNILHAAYEGTLLEAARIADQEGTRKKVYLTLIGAGAFGNKLEWIADVFKNNTYIHKALRYANIDVYLIIYAGDAPDNASSRYDVIRNAVKQLNAATSQDVEHQLEQLYRYINHLRSNIVMLN